MSAIDPLLVATLLRQHGLLPPESNALRALAPGWLPQCQPGCLLLPLLRAAWTHYADEAGDRHAQRSARRKAAQFSAWHQAGAVLSWGWPADQALAAPQQVPRAVHDRLFWWPRGVPTGRRVAIVSSRLGRSHRRLERWSAALHHVCSTLEPHATLLVTAAQTTTCPFLERCSALFGLPLLRLQLPGTRQTLDRWWQRSTGLPAGDDLPQRYPAFVSPPLQEQDTPHLPLRDQLVAAVSEQLIVLRMRARGHVEQIVRARCEQHEGHSTSHVSLVVGSDLVPEPLAAALPSARHLRVGETLQRPAAPWPWPALGLSPPILTPQQLPVNEYLTHWTRARPGPWPGQTQAEYYDGFILGTEPKHTALATLARIAASRRLLASGDAIRGSTPVVCFTALPLPALPQMRVFRAHRGRWDGEPYGLCLRRAWLEQRGARPVHYGDVSLWEQLDAAEQPFFQCQATASQAIDWSREQEWRHLGDLALDELTADDAMLFVPTHAEALQLAPYSAWPIVVLDASS